MGIKRGYHELLVTHISNWARLRLSLRVRGGRDAAAVELQPEEPAKVIAEVVRSKLVECDGKISFPEQIAISTSNINKACLET